MHNINEKPLMQVQNIKVPSTFNGDIQYFNISVKNANKILLILAYITNSIYLQEQPTGWAMRDLKCYENFHLLFLGTMCIDIPPGRVLPSPNRSSTNSCTLRINICKNT